MAHEVGVGVVGMGWMGEAHSRSYRALRDRFHDLDIDARLVVCADSVPGRAEAAAHRFGFERAAVDWREVVDDPAVQAISVTAPNDLHLEVIRAAVALGKHVNCEKPVGRTPDETIEAAELAAQAGVVTFVGYNYRWAPVVQHAHDLIARGELGRITHYRGRFLNGYASDPNGLLSWRFQIEHGFGTLADLLSHVIDMAHFIVGPVAEVVANRQTFIARRPLAVRGAGTHYDAGSPDAPKGDVTNEDYVAALVRFGSGAQGTVEACRVIVGPKCDMAFEVHGTNGAIRWTMERMNELEVLRRREKAPAEEGYTAELSGPAHPFHSAFNPAWGLNLGFDDLKAIEAAQFLKAVVTGARGAPDFADAAAVARVQQAIIASWASGGWEAVPAAGPTR